MSVMWRVIDVMGALWAKHDTTAALTALETLWPDRTPDRASQIAGHGFDLALGARRPSEASRWAERIIRVSDDSVAETLRVAEAFARAPGFADSGAVRSRALFAAIDGRDAVAPRLTETTTEHAVRNRAFRARTLSALGRSLLALGRTRAGFDTLSVATATGWDLSSIRTMRSAAFTLRDSATGWTMTGRWMADPSVAAKVRDSITALAVTALGTRAWGAVLEEQRKIFASRVLETSFVRSPLGSPRLVDAYGTVRPLRTVAAGKVTAIVFSSRNCGWAIEDLAQMNAVAAEIKKRGAQLLFVIDDEAGPSPALTAFLAEHKVTVPVWFDVDHSMSKAFNNWGTPQYYILDAQGRSRFNAVSDAGEALVRVEALRVAQ
jgi:hypothetical protein